MSVVPLSWTYVGPEFRYVPVPRYLASRQSMILFMGQPRGDGIFLHFFTSFFPF
uniref:Uncharacterized protein n=1 Tax=Meloidogyne enterolobii TaxID=390850 RepID=A0A6V7X6R8_MELEN|nr:unnamed protein product [Meloidogyne enterolobii]